jgi:hypothetical protein
LCVLAEVAQASATAEAAGARFGPVLVAPLVRVAAYAGVDVGRVTEDALACRLPVLLPGGPIAFDCFKHRCVTSTASASHFAAELLVSAEGSLMLRHR